MAAVAAVSPLARVQSDEKCLHRFGVSFSSRTRFDWAFSFAGLIIIPLFSMLEVH